MRHPLLLLLVATLGTMASGLNGAEPLTTSTGTETLDPAVLTRRTNFGYSPEEIKKLFGQPRTIAYDERGLAKDRLKAPPAVGVHPRVLFNPEDLPALRRRLAETTPGKLQMEAIRTTLTELITGPKAKYKDLYENAVKGVASPALAEVEPACAIEYECFRCLIDNDAAGGARAAAALATLAGVEAGILTEMYAKEDAKAAAAKPAAAKTDGPSEPTLAPGAKPFRDYQATKTVTQAGMLGLAYDFVYGWMNEAQRTTVRAAIATASANMTCIGCEALPAFPAGTSNWIPMHMRLVLLTLAIEGEKGYDPTTVQRCIAAYKNYLGAGLFPSGEMFESMGKNFICSENILPLAHRGERLLSLAALRRQVDSYYLHAMDPWGKRFTFFDSLGGRGNTTPMFDVMTMKYLYPEDPAIDFVYRNTVGDDYAVFKDKVRFGHPFYLNNGMIRAIIGTPYDESKTWEQARDAATAGKALTYFSDDTGNLITRSGWSNDAVQFHFLTRTVAGGHIYCDRGHFSLHALGRYWGIYKPLRQVEEHYSPRNRSVVLIDGQGPGMAPAKCIDQQDGPLATFVAADVKSSFDYTTGGNSRFPKGGIPVPFCANDFRLRKSDLPWMNAPYSDLPNWQTSQKGSERWLPHVGVERAFRSGGLVRGAHPYALVIDDLAKDQETHEYRWGMVLEDDLEITATEVATTAEAFRNDVLLAAPEDTEKRQLLVRVLEAEGLVDPQVPAAIDTFTLPNQTQKPVPIKRLEVVVKAVAPRFKTLLFPHRAGTDLPVTTWNADRTELVIAWKDQRDVLTFRVGKDGRTRYRIIRDGKPLVSLD